MQVEVMTELASAACAFIGAFWPQHNPLAGVVGGNRALA
jgi:hypothetical protein